MLDAARDRLGRSYTGDLDAPRVEIVSEPLLGRSMDLPASHGEVWPCLEATARALAARCDVYAIACNTLNVYAAALDELDLDAELVSFQGAVADWAGREGVERAALLGARTVAGMGEWSPYRSLADNLAVNGPDDLDEVHRLILDIKADGGSAREHRQRLEAIVARLDDEVVLLACTELPLVAGPIEGRRLVDVTGIVAEELVRRWSGARGD